eukprot:scaffold239485_cov33-Tisochrysis_lutea.AAC.2
MSSQIAENSASAGNEHESITHSADSPSYNQHAPRPIAFTPCVGNSLCRQPPHREVSHSGIGQRSAGCLGWQDLWKGGVLLGRGHATAKARPIASGLRGCAALKSAVTPMPRAVYRS